MKCERQRSKSFRKESPEGITLLQKGFPFGGSLRAKSSFAPMGRLKPKQNKDKALKRTATTKIGIPKQISKSKQNERTPQSRLEAPIMPILFFGTAKAIPEKEPKLSEQDINTQRTASPLHQMSE